MKVFSLLEISIAKAEKGLWYDHDQRAYDPTGWGIVLKFFAGTVVRPMTKPRYWFVKGVPSKWNEFNPDYHWRFKIWLPLAPFLSIAVGEAGAYIGFKVFDLESAKYKPLVGDAEVHPGSKALTLSATTRRTRWV